MPRPSPFGRAESEIRIFRHANPQNTHIQPGAVPLSTKNAIQEGYLSSEPTRSRRKHNQAADLPARRCGLTPATPTWCWVPDKWIDEHPDAVQDLRRRQHRGLDALFVWRSRPREIRSSKKDNPEMTDRSVAQAIDKMKS
jgi:hypothetical protein